MKESAIRGKGPAPAPVEPSNAGVRDPSARLRCDCTLLGVPVGLVCGGLAEVAGVRAATAAWQGERDPTAAALTIEVSSCASSPKNASFEFDVSGSQLRLKGSGVDGAANAAERRASCALSPEWFDKPSDLLTRVLEPLALFLVTQNGRVPIHASAIQVGELAILFAGPSGAGKSSLALAAHLADLTVLSEDSVYVRLEPSLALWGWNGPIHLLPGEVWSSAGPLRMRNGRIKQAVTFQNATARTRPARAVAVCILAAGSRSPTLRRLTRGSALDFLHPLEPGFHLLQREIHAVQRLLCRNGAWRLGLSKSPGEAIALVLAKLERLNETASKLPRR